MNIRTTLQGIAIACATLATAFAFAKPPAAMEAIRFYDYGDPSVLVHEVGPTPTPKKGEVLIKVHAAAVNPVDWKIREGKLKGFIPRPPMIPGFDVSGTIASLGEGVTEYKVGDEVFGYLFLTAGGTYAQYVAAPLKSISPKPANLTHNQAAAVPLAALTAWQALFDTAKLTEGQTVLIHGAAGGVGHFAVQLAKAKGAKVIATGSENNREFLTTLGADQFINYKASQFEDLVRDVDVVLDTVGGDTLERSYGVLKKGGYLVSIVGPPSPTRLNERELKGNAILAQPNAAELAEITTLIQAGKVTPTISDTFPLAQAAKAHEKSQTGHTRGKIVIEVIPAAATPEKKK